PEGAPVVPLRITTDPRTNSIIVAGSRNDLDVVDTLILRLEGSGTEQRQNEVIHLHNAFAADAANTLTTFVTNSLTVYNTPVQYNRFLEMDLDAVVVPDPVSNRLLISATPRMFAELMRIINEIDSPPPQVVIQVTIAEVDLTSDEEFGMELGLQSPV